MICHPFTENAYQCIVSCVLSFVDSKAQLRYLGSPKRRYTSVVSVVILLIGVETSPISRFHDRDARQRPWLRSLRFATSKDDAQYVSSWSWPTHTEGWNNWTCKLTKKKKKPSKLALWNSLVYTGHFSSIINNSLKFSGHSFWIICCPIFQREYGRLRWKGQHGDRKETFWKWKSSRQGSPPPAWFFQTLIQCDI